MNYHIVFKRRIEASSLIEVITAMVIISIVLGISIQIFFNIQKSTQSLADEKVKVQMINIANESILNSNWEDSLVQFQGWNISKEMIPYSKNGNLKVLRIIASDTHTEKYFEIKYLIVASNKL